MKPTTSGKVHHGQNIKRLREIMGVKQEAMAHLLNITQQSFSEMEKRELIEDAVIEKVADALKVPAGAIKNMTEEAVMNYIYTFNDKVENSGGYGSFAATNNNTDCSFNPIDKIVELYEEKMKLYERMLKEKEEKVAFMEKWLSDKNQE